MTLLEAYHHHMHGLSGGLGKEQLVTPSRVAQHFNQLVD